MGKILPEFVALTWAEVQDRLDMTRLHFTGKVAHADLRLALQASSAHVYYTYPYVLSWSLLEAMACGALIIGRIRRRSAM